MKKYFALFLLFNNIITTSIAQNRIEQVKKNIVGKWISSDRLVDITYSKDMKYQIKRNFLNILKSTYEINIVKDSIFINFSTTDFTMKNIVFINQYLHSLYKKRRLHLYGY